MRNIVSSILSIASCFIILFGCVVTSTTYKETTIEGKFIESNMSIQDLQRLLGDPDKIRKRSFEDEWIYRYDDTIYYISIVNDKVFDILETPISN